MFGADHNGLLDHLKRLGFKTDLLKGKIIATQKCFFLEGNCIWINNAEEMLYPHIYGYKTKNIGGVLVFSPP